MCVFLCVFACLCVCVRAFFSAPFVSLFAICWQQHTSHDTHTTVSFSTERTNSNQFYTPLCDAIISWRTSTRQSINALILAGSHTHTLYTHLLVMPTHTQCMWEREMADLAGSALETESRKTVRTPSKQQQQQQPQQHPVVATAAAVHTGARHQCIPVNMQQQCVASIQIHISICMYVCTCMCTYQKEKVAGSWRCCCTTKKQTVGRR